MNFSLNTMKIKLKALIRKSVTLYDVKVLMLMVILLHIYQILVTLCYECKALFCKVIAIYMQNPTVVIH